MKKIAILLITMISIQSKGETGYEKLKMFFDKAASPSSVLNVRKKIPSIKDCAMFSLADQNTAASEKLVLVSYQTIPVGPEFPSEQYDGIGFSGADMRPGLFFEKYQEDLNSQGLSLSYSYTYTGRYCSGPKDDRECEDYESSVSGAGVIRVNDKYILFKKTSAYGYCWF